MADGKQVCESSGKVVKVEIPMETDTETDNAVKNPPNDKIFYREISLPEDISDSNSDSVFSSTISASSFRRKSSSEININGGITPSPVNRMRPKSTSSCRSSSVSDDDRSLQLSPHFHGRRPRTYSDSLNVDCSNASPSPSPVIINISFLFH